jgi:hypothetical protein
LGITLRLSTSTIDRHLRILPAGFDHAAQHGLTLRAYPVWARASRAAWAFLKAIRPAASWSRARWFSSFFDQRIRIARLRFSHEWQASTTQRRARQPGWLVLRSISSPRLRMCGVSP